MLKISCVVTTHRNLWGARNIFHTLENQTYKPFEILVYASGYDSQEIDFGWVSYEPDLKDWGNDKRRKGLGRASGDYVGFFSDDDFYVNCYLEKMANKIRETGVDLVYCDWVHYLLYPNQPSRKVVIEVKPIKGLISSGNFLVRASIAKVLGYKFEGHNADGQFIEALIRQGTTHVRVPEILHIHN